MHQKQSPITKRLYIQHDSACKKKKKKKQLKLTLASGRIKFFGRTPEGKLKSE